jgi:hypothetical protein
LVPNCFLPALALALIGCATAHHGDHAEWVSLFNGKDLAGWVVHCQATDRRKTFWTADQGTILCDSIGRKDHNYVWLLSEGEYADFELRLKFQVYRDCPGNSGLQFRSRYDSGANGGWLDGPQVDIHAPPPMTWRTGLIYDETREVRRWIFPSLKDSRMDPAFAPERFVFKYSDEGDGWNDLTLICQGMRVTTVVNGITRTDWDATGVLDSAEHARHDVGRKGHFALQLHTGDELKIRFRDIRIRQCPDPKRLQ